MPLFSVLAAAAQVGLGVDASHLEPHNIRYGEVWRQRDVESTVGIEQDGVLSIELDAFFVCQKHRDASTVFAVVENLFGFVARGVEVDFRLTVNGALARDRIVTIDGVGRSEAGEG